jgi:DNA-binding Lrp family transcriptional regulator
MELDEIDKQILCELKDNCHQTYKNIANKVGSNINTVASRIKKLEKQNYILKYLTIIDYNKIGICTSALIKINLKNPNALDKNDLQDILNNPNTILAYGMTGRFDVNAIVSCSDFDNLIEEISTIGKNKNVRTITSEFIIKEYQRIDEHNPFKKNMARKKDNKPIKKMIDGLDRNILFEIRDGANKPLRELSQTLNSPISTIKERISKMEKNGIIQGYVASINYSKLGYFCYSLISIKLESDHVNDQEIIEKIQDIPQVAALFRVLGKFDVYAGIIVPGMDQAIDVIKQIYSVAGVQKTESQVALAAFKSGTQYNPFYVGER